MLIEHKYFSDKNITTLNRTNQYLRLSKYFSLFVFKCEINNDLFNIHSTSRKFIGIIS